MTQANRSEGQLLQVAIEAARAAALRAYRLERRGRCQVVLKRSQIRRLVEYARGLTSCKDAQMKMAWQAQVARWLVRNMVASRQNYLAGGDNNNDRAIAKSGELCAMRWPIVPLQGPHGKCAEQVR